MQERQFQVVESDIVQLLLSDTDINHYRYMRPVVEQTMANLYCDGLLNVPRAKDNNKSTSNH